MDGKNLVDGDKCWNIVGLHLITLMHDQVAGASVNRRINRTVLQLYFGVLYCSQISPHGSLERFRVGLHSVILFFGHDSLVPESGITARLDYGIGCLSLVPG